MQNTGRILSLSAFLLATGAAIASSQASQQLAYYHFNNDENNPCLPSQTLEEGCTTSGEVTCTVIEGFTAHMDSNCTLVLRRDEP